jgi:hypothetical protein
MKTISYIIAAILVIGWAIIYIIHGEGWGVHVLPVIAFATVIQQIIQNNRFASQLFHSPHLRKRVWKFHATL